MLCDDRDKPLQTSQNRPMDHDRSSWWFVRIRRLLRSTVFEVEPFWELEIQLDSCALERPLQGVFNRDIYLWAVERSIPWVNLPFPRVVLLERCPKLLITFTTTFATNSRKAQSRGRILGRLRLCGNQRSVKWSGRCEGQTKNGRVWGYVGTTHSLSFVPGLDLAEVIVGSGGEFKREFESKQPIREFHEIK